MVHSVDIEVFRIAQTQVKPIEVERWLKYLGVKDIDNLIPDIEDVSDPALLIALAAKRCYMSFEVGLNPNISQIRKNYVDYFDNLLKSKHGSVFEHAVYTYAIEGVSRVFTGEMNRHRAGCSISEGSMRFIRYDDIPYWLPTSIRIDEKDNQELAFKKACTQQSMLEVFQFVEQKYKELVNEVWNLDERDKNFAYKKKITSCLRRIIPMGVATGGVWSLNIRALRHVIAMRTSESAEEEIFYVCNKIAEDIIQSEPLLFKDFHKLDNGGYQPDNWKI